jgi:thiamine-phosphate pyrophosphorylase
MLNKKILEEAGLYFITDRKLSKKTDIDDVKAAIKVGVKIIQYREKEFPTKAIYSTAKELREITKKNNVLLIINDRVDIALAVDADGIHLGLDDMPYDIARKLLGNKIIGLTVHNVEEAIEAENLGADYVGISPIFATTTKLDAGKPAGLEMVKKVKEKINIPFVAIGGINFENLDDVLKAGAKSVAAISAIVTKDNVEEESRKFIEKIEEYNH